MAWEGESPTKPGNTSVNPCITTILTIGPVRSSSQMNNSATSVSGTILVTGNSSAIEALKVEVNKNDTLKRAIQSGQIQLTVADETSAVQSKEVVPIPEDCYMKPYPEETQEKDRPWEFGKKNDRFKFIPKGRRR